MAKILLVESDNQLSKIVAAALTAEQHIVDRLENGRQAMTVCTDRYDLLILTSEIPGASGIEVCRAFRSAGNDAPVLFVSACNTIHEKERAFDAGADDFLTRPYNIKELVIRSRSLLRRPHISGNYESAKVVGDLMLDQQSHMVLKAGKPVSLTPKEFALLDLLLRHPNQVFSAEALLVRVWPSTSETSPDVVRTYINKLRNKIKGSSVDLVTVHGVGYKLENCSRASTSSGKASSEKNGKRQRDAASHKQDILQILRYANVAW